MRIEGGANAAHFRQVQHHVLVLEDLGANLRLIKGLSDYLDTSFVITKLYAFFYSQVLFPVE